MSVNQFRPQLVRELTYHAPYVTKTNMPAMYNPATRPASRWVNTLRCNRTKSASVRMPKKGDCYDCTDLQPFHWKGNNYQHPKGEKYEDLLFSGDWDVSYNQGCLDPRDANFDSFAQVHCQDRCAGRPEGKAPCCQTLDLSVLNRKCAQGQRVNDPEWEAKWRAEHADAAANPDSVGAPVSGSEFEHAAEVAAQ